MFFEDNLFVLDLFNPNFISKKLKRAKNGAAGKTKIDDIKGCQIKPEQLNISSDEQGSIYLLTIVSATCRLFGAK